MVNRFSYDTPPKNFPKAIKTARGWVNPNNNRDVYVAIPNLNTRYDTGGDNKADILKVYFGKSTAYAVGDPLSVKVQFSEFVDVTAGASLVVNTVPGRSTLSVTSTVANAETVTLGSKTYTFQDTLTNVDGNVKVGATVNESVANLLAAVTLGAGAGTAYATAMTIHPTIGAANGTHVAATVTLSTIGAISNAETVTIGSKVYTFQDTLTNVDGNVKIGASIEATVTNLINAINLGTGAGTTYATAMTIHPSVSAAAGTHVAASGTFTTTDQPSNGETVTIGDKTYTFQDTLTNVDGNVKIGGTQAASVTNLINAINLGAGTPGTDYALAMTAHSTVSAANGTASTVVVTAKTAGGTGNSIATTKSFTNGSWGGETLSGGISKIVATAKTAGANGNTLNSTETMTNGSFGAATLTGGISKLVFTAKTSGTAGNSLASTENMTNGSFSNATLAGGAATTLYAAAQAKTALVVFNKQNDNTTAEVVPANAANMSIATQTIGGTITDYNNSVYATGTLTLTDDILADETVVIDSKTYTFKSTLTNTDGYVKLGGDNSESLRNLVNAINLGAGGGANYAAATTVHSTVTALQGGNNVMTVKAKTAGTGGNSITTTDTLSNGAFGAETLTGGAVVASNKVLTSGIVAAIVNASVA